MVENVLAIQDLCISARNNILVRNISLHIEKGTVHGLVGESGSGKTLTALSILGILPGGITVNSGSIEFKGKGGVTQLLSAKTGDLNRIRGAEISMIFQEPMTSLNPSMRCGKQAMEPLIIRGYSKMTARKKVLELFREVKLPDVERVFRAWPHELSGGQRQRVMIAMALVTSPDLLIADEPTTALDVTVQKSILELLMDLREKFSLSILFITHDLMVLKQVADRISMMVGGEIVETGKTEKILSSPSTPYARGLLTCKPGLKDKPFRLSTVDDFISGKPVRVPDREKPVFTGKEVLLSINDLNVEFKSYKRSIKAVRSVSFTIYKGETLGLVGESGCGKTTLGRTILQLVENFSGSIEYKGIQLDQLKPGALRNVRRKIQIVFQDPYSSLNPGKTVGSIIAEPMFVHRLVSGRTEIENETLQLLEKVGLDKGAVNLYPHQFSGGQRQRIGIARALACRPDFIVLDESVSALDVSVQARILNLLNDLKDEYGLTYLFISHDLTVVKYMSQRVLVMAGGEIIESGTADLVYQNPQTSYTRQLIEAIPV